MLKFQVLKQLFLKSKSSMKLCRDFGEIFSDVKKDHTGTETSETIHSKTSCRIS